MHAVDDLLQVRERNESAGSADATLTMSYELRCKSRLRTALDDGTEVGVVLPRGTVLRDGDRLRAEDGRIIEIIAAGERVSTVRGADAGALARACYHLGNRHVAVQIGDGWARYLHDHVLDDMLVAMGFEITMEIAPFEPESGAYGGHAHHHHHD